MNVLLTGASAPISADMAKVLKGGGHRVIAVDCSRMAIGRFSPFVDKFYDVPAPTCDAVAFHARVLGVMAQERIDWVIPTSEEVFWLAQSEPIAAKLFAPAFSMLQRLHDKLVFSRMARALGAGPRFSVAISSAQEAAAIPQELLEAGLVAKPVFSRFGHDVVLKPTRAQLLALDFSRSWVVQTYVAGPELCVYAIANKGELTFLQCYRPAYRAGQGASVYFEPAEDLSVAAFVSKFVQEHQLSGQVSFDVKLTPEGVVALECNPRGTSGVHLAAQDAAAYCQALVGGIVQRSPQKPQARMLAAPFLLCHGLSLLTSARARSAWRGAKDAPSAAGLPLWAGGVALGALICKAAASGTRIERVSTVDFEWNGNE